MKTKLSIIGAALVLAAVTHFAWAECGCVVNVAANKCPNNYNTPPAYWQLKDRFGNVKPWPTYNVPVPVSNGDQVTVIWGYSNCCATNQGNDAVVLYWTTCPPSGMHWTGYPLNANRIGATWEVHVDCGSNSFSLTTVAGYECN